MCARALHPYLMIVTQKIFNDMGVAFNALELDLHGTCPLLLSCVRVRMCVCIFSSHVLCHAQCVSNSMISQTKLFRFHESVPHIHVMCFLNSRSCCMRT